MQLAQDTICAIATHQGGAIGIVRVSGPNAVRLTEEIFHPAGKRLSEKAAYTLSYGEIREPGNGAFVDDVLVSLFRAPHSYTGEDSTEISCHASPYILQKVCTLLIDAGCRQAEPGEFTRRAFMNGKMDLSQAEAVADLIASSSAAAHRLASSQMKGAFSRRLGALKDSLVKFQALVELELDFSEENVQFADRAQLFELAGNIEKELSGLASSFSTGNAIRNGIPVAIVGRTNTGKSTLLNQLLGDDRALVSDTAGTTRDSIEDTMVIGGTMFRFIDTAGIRRSVDTIEEMGIERSYRKADEARIVLWVMDCTAPADQELEASLLPHCQGKTLIKIMNKCDCLESVSADSADTIWISARQGFNLEALHKRLLEAAALPETGPDNVMVTNLRHYQALTAALDCISRVREGISQDIPGDLLSQDIRECTYHLEDILGQVSTDQVLQHIFSHFCIGK